MITNKLKKKGVKIYNMNLTTKEKQEITKIHKMTHIEMCSLWRQASSGHPYFDNTLPYSKEFEKRLFTHFGGFTPKISKKIGW